MSALILAVISGRFSHRRQIWEYINVSWSIDFFKCSTSTHLFTLDWMHFVPWFTLSLSVVSLMSVKDIHQWLVIIWCPIMFDPNTFIHVMGHVLLVVCVEYFRVCWHSIYSTSFIATKFMRFQLSWPELNLFSYAPNIFIEYGHHTSLYIVCYDDQSWHMSIMPIHSHCTDMYVRLLCILHIRSHM